MSNIEPPGFTYYMQRFIKHQEEDEAMWKKLGPQVEELADEFKNDSFFHSINFEDWFYGENEGYIKGDIITFLKGKYKFTEIEMFYLSEKIYDLLNTSLSLTEKSTTPESLKGGSGCGVLGG